MLTDNTINAYVLALRARDRMALQQPGPSNRAPAPPVLYWTSHFYGVLVPDGGYTYARVLRMGTEDNLHVIGAPVTRMLDAELLLVPINFADLEHWALASIDTRQRKITFYDSIATGGAP
ncbi:hypothetical protein GPECTOR_140g682 [Gonium pectorale]|uniref:Ubiquitin-like protease family profile domain-containing protein n=1 Tax=Gonium pectorale TaxID=33097 RepID=A0A150FY27_GONPE|nr:hypothetical protein GPECTOR_140g682 [Gonium pectorale]|eukprot:KXZ42506.1 hypothetical protein GPECTOR_140g682 [Gonium pectorale]